MVLIAASATYGAAVAYVAYPRGRDLLMCAAALGVHGLAILVLSLSGHVHPVVPILFGNALVAVALALLSEGAYLHQPRRPPRWLIWLPVGVVPLAFVFLMDDIRTRIVISSVVSIFQCGLALKGLFLGRREPVERGRYLVMAGVMLTVLSFVVRLWAVARGEVAMTTVVDSNAVQAATFLNSILSVTLIAMGLILMNQERLTQALEGSEEFARGILDSVSSQIAVLDRHGRIVAVNETWKAEARARGDPPPLPQGPGDSYLACLEAWSPGLAEKAAGVSEVLAQRQASFSLEYELSGRADPRWFLMTVSQMRAAAGGAVAVLTDITANKQAENYKHFRSEVLSLLAAAQPLDAVLQAIVQGIEHLHPSMICSVLLLDERGEHLAHGIAPSLPADYNAALEGARIGLGVGSCGTAAFTGERVVVEDISTHPYWVNYRQLAARAGLGACWSQPIQSSTQQVLGTFAIYHHEPHSPSVADIELIEQSARLASIAIERSRASAALQKSEESYRLLVEAANEGICVAQDGVIKFANPKLLEIVGVSLSELIDQSFLNFIDEADHELVLANHRKRLTGLANDLKYPMRIVTRHHGVRWCEISGVLFEWQGRPATLNLLTDITERRQMEERIREMAYHDTLTQLANRRLLIDHLGLAMASHKRSGRYGALIFMDLDNFKILNDTQGHHVGDLLLMEVAQRLRRSVRACDTVARFGGDEFVLLLSDLHEDLITSRTQAQGVAEKIRTTVSEHYRLSVPQREGEAVLIEHECSASIGVVMFMGQSGSENEVVKQADAAMYQAKEAGRNTIRFSDVVI
ncbi:MAG TPA: diguanylate cyclase [Aquabacterium sp.]|uniref:diguanylate cyclase n=1 Tax=Aquabacterium sp. TaxID=1872578 RepID=UPI002E317788|nr:diguanylate cyclase [Aquabacterium sp.]HEX5372587.1 diguanylate cyclase [Aquabacterium sp.]